MIFTRFITLLVCVAGIVTCALAAHSVPSWNNLQLDMQIILVMISFICLMMLATMVCVPEQKLRVIRTLAKQRRGAF